MYWCVTYFLWPRRGIAATQTSRQGFRRRTRQATLAVGRDGVVGRVSKQKANARGEVGRYRRGRWCVGRDYLLVHGAGNAMPPLQARMQGKWPAQVSEFAFALKAWPGVQAALFVFRVMVKYMGGVDRSWLTTASRRLVGPPAFDLEIDVP